MTDSKWVVLHSEFLVYIKYFYCDSWYKISKLNGLDAYIFNFRTAVATLKILEGGLKEGGGIRFFFGAYILYKYNNLLYD